MTDEPNDDVVVAVASLDFGQIRSLRQAASLDLGRARDAWNLLGTMSRSKRPEAGIFLLGLMRGHANDLTRMTILVRAVSYFPSEAADTLKAEFYRVPSRPTTRTYLNQVLRALMDVLAPRARGALKALADDRKLSIKWRRRFGEAAWQLNG